MRPSKRHCSRRSRGPARRQGPPPPTVLALPPPLPPATSPGVRFLPIKRSFPPALPRRSQVDRRRLAHINCHATPDGFASRNFRSALRRSPTEFRRFASESFGIRGRLMRTPLTPGFRCWIRSRSGWSRLGESSASALSRRGFERRSSGRGIERVRRLVARVGENARSSGLSALGRTRSPRHGRARSNARPRISLPT